MQFRLMQIDMCLFKKFFAYFMKNKIGSEELKVNPEGT